MGLLRAFGSLLRAISGNSGVSAGENGLRFVGEEESWEPTKCVANEGAIYLYEDLGVQ